MKILYATSITYPSPLANRQQIVSTVAALHALGTDITLGIARITGIVSFPYIVFPGTAKSPFLAFCYAMRIRKDAYTHIYCREDRLMFFIIIWCRVLRLNPKFYFEAHIVHVGFAFAWLLRKVDGMVVITHGLKEDLIRKGLLESRTTIAPDGVDLERFIHLPDRLTLRKKYDLPVDKILIGYAGSFGGYYAWKGVDILLTAARMAPSKWHFMLIGGRPSEISELRDTFDATNVSIEGQWDPKNVPEFLAAMDVLVIPNKKGNVISERHTSPMKLFEYMASGVPAVASDLTSIREIANEEEVAFFTPNDPESLVRAIEYVLENPDESLTRAEKARIKMRDYSWKSRAETILAFLKKEG